MKPLDLVRLKAECTANYVGVLPRGEHFVYLGDITQMPGHGVFVALGKGKTYCGFHTDSFEVIPEGEV